VRDEIIKTLRKQKNRLFNSHSSTTAASSSITSSKLTTSSNRSSKQLQRTQSDSSSFRTLKKSHDSARLINRESSNCSNLPINLSLKTNAILINDKSSKQAEKKTLIGYLLKLFKINHDVNSSKTTKTYSFSSRSCCMETHSSPLQNYSLSSAASPFNSNYIKMNASEIEENSNIIRLLNSEPYCNTNNNNSQFYNMQPSNYNLSINNKIATLNRQTSYLNNEIGFKRGSGSVKMNYMGLSNNNSTNIRRTLSQMSSESTGIHLQKSIMTQIPTIPPPPLPIGALPNQQQQQQIQLSRKSTMNESRLSTFKSSHLYNNTNNTLLEKPIITPPQIVVNKRLASYDENQYLTPEYHYSMVDSEFQSEYYCDDGICSVGVEDELSNNYQEVVDQDILDELNNTNNVAYSNNFNKRLKQLNTTADNTKIITNNNNNHKSKLKDLITMPEELDKDYSIGHSNVSDSSIFKGGSIIIMNDNKLRKNNETKEFLDKIPSESNSSVRSLTSSTGTSTGTSMSHSSTLFYNIDPDENSKAKRILQRI
jgi:hypothetical protein